MEQIAVIFLGISFFLGAVALLGESGFTVDLRSRGGRRLAIRGGRRATDPVMQRPKQTIAHPVLGRHRVRPWSLVSVR